MFSKIINLGSLITTCKIKHLERSAKTGFKEEANSTAYTQYRPERNENDNTLPPYV
jgi:hypothetical protein